ncbi:MAG: shikimate dehydrogenase [Pseudomonadales bacterium]
MDRYAVVGNPVAHSRSPDIHHMFARQTGAALSYERILTTTEQFDVCVTGFFASEGKGLNVTLPFKEQAWALAENLDDAARQAGAVNVLMPKAAGIWGGNSDGIGLVRDLMRNHAVALAGMRVLVLGAGGAARGVVGALLEAAVSEIVIVNRTHARAQTLAEIWSDSRVGAARMQQCRGTFGLVINATSASLQGEVPEIDERVLDATSLCYDLVYAPRDTAFVTWARTRGARGVDGLGMLVEQAAESFFIWREVRPNTTPVVRALRQALSGG